MTSRSSSAVKISLGSGSSVEVSVVLVRSGDDAIIMQPPSFLRATGLLQKRVRGHRSHMWRGWSDDDRSAAATLLESLSTAVRAHPPRTSTDRGGGWLVLLATLPAGHDVGRHQVASCSCRAYQRSHSES